jgi:hypothetical protein
MQENGILARKSREKMVQEITPTKQESATKENYFLRV